MILSFWRRAHLLLAIFSFLFLTITSITGVILSFKPIQTELSECHINNASEISIAQLITTLESNFEEIIELKIGENEFLQLSVITENGDYEEFYADPKTGKKIASLQDEGESALFSFSRTLHRSLFLGNIGRTAIGITSFLLLLIAISGTILIIKRQLGIKHFFSKVTKDNFSQYWHVWLGRMSLLIIIVIALTGTYLSMDRFGLLPDKQEINHSIDFDSMTETPVLKKDQFKFFRNTKLSDVELIQFPFSKDLEDYFQVRLHDKDVIINQFNGKIISSENVDKFTVLEKLNYNLHTGKGSLVWAIILCMASLNILFFIYSGFRMTLIRLKGKTKNSFNKEESPMIILVGSEGGNTLRIAKQFQQSLIQKNQKVYLDDLNNYTYYSNLEHLIIFTSTYGNGEAPINAKNFIKKFNDIDQKSPFHYTIIGFGSTNYPQFCKYADDVEKSLKQSDTASEFIPIHRIDRQSKQQFNSWISEWSKQFGVSIEVNLNNSSKDHAKLETFKILSKSLPSEQNNQTYSIELASNNKKVKSGDLIAIKPSIDKVERHYSIGKTMNGNILLSIRKHSLGICSTYLSELDINERFSARIQPNKTFHFPSNAKRIVGICNGTGIAPFLGMAVENINKVEFHLYWGGKSKEALNVFETQIIESTKRKRISSFKPVFSAEKETKPTYVQDKLKEDESFIKDCLKSETIFMICGSIVMKEDVLSLLNSISKSTFNVSISDYEKNGYIKTDCY
ncbi:MAG: PepSY domain-containing protein [Crocinitomicaceae bacterium]|nr:PepSY domain-containing protein [Crocinitomicaceae bacterium]